MKGDGGGIIFSGARGKKEDHMGARELGEIRTSLTGAGVWIRSWIGGRQKGGTEGVA